MQVTCHGNFVEKDRLKGLPRIAVATNGALGHTMLRQPQPVVTTATSGDYRTRVSLSAHGQPYVDMGLGVW